MRPSRMTVGVLVLLFHYATVGAFRFKRNADFGKCWTDNVQGLNTSNFSDPYQWWGKDSTRTHQVITPHPQLNKLGCETLCGDGFQLWPASDTFLRIVLWVFPMAVLVTRFQFAPLGPANMAFVIAHLIGDPIDSMWSLLTRREVNRRFYRHALKSGYDNCEHIAAIWAAYDELGWQEPMDYFFRSLEDRKRGLPFLTPALGVSRGNSPYSPRSSAESVAPENTAQGSSTSQVPNHRLSGPSDTSDPLLGSNPQHIPDQHPRVFDQPTKEEIYYIQLASQRLTSDRSESHLRSWFAILALLAALAGAYTRTWVLQTNDQTSHTIATVCMLFILLPLVRISGGIGSFTSPSAAVEIIFELRRNLRILCVQRKGPRPQLFPPLSIGDKLDSISTPGQYRGDISTVEDASRLEHRKELEVIREWPKIASWMGMNSSWRPCKHIMTIGGHSSGDWGRGRLLAISATFAIAGYIPALGLSYFTPTVGFGCRSMAWTLILAVWIISAALDEIFRCLVSSEKILYYSAWAKDTLFSIFVIGTITALQVGLFNSCYCRTDALTLGREAHADIGPQSPEDFRKGWKRWLAWPLVSFFVVIALYSGIGVAGGDKWRTLLCKSQTTRQDELEALKNKRNNFPEIEIWNANPQIEIGNAPGPSIEIRPPSPPNTRGGELRDMPRSQAGLLLSHHIESKEEAKLSI
ncbi:hypothetical protein GP486_002840 [Trichoglossum hirsutum]|uniref:Uncharacterized protein n=1 Tax=Trichoglossum hirsutum TaxID=265104 RepID=A0A9P8LEA0_9PEZI|nr:hypothetical protein GP486_002840 [Trichoglossum hirsutum]